MTGKVVTFITALSIYTVNFHKACLRQLINEWEASPA